MLRITCISEQRAVTLKLEGKLAGPWVAELQGVWRSIKVTSGTRALVADLNDVTLIDRAGETLLRQMHRGGTTLLADGPYMRQRLGRITGGK